MVRGISSRFATLLLVATLARTAIADTISSTLEFSEFQLYKNSGFGECNETGVVLGPQQTSKTAFIRSVFLPRKVENYCAFLVQPVILLPTDVHEDAFFPWWPTYLIQTVSLALSYCGLVYTYKNVTKRPAMASRKKLYNSLWLFWVQMGIDTVRLVVWFFKEIQGFAVSKRFAWTSSVLYLLPFTYMFVLSAAFSRGKLPRSDPSTSKSSSQSLSEKRIQPSELRRSFSSSSKALAGISFIMFAMAIGSLILHFLPSTFSSRSRPYTMPTSTIQTLYARSDIPGTCVDWLQPADLVSLGFFDQTTDQRLSAGLQLFALVMTSAVVFTWCLRKSLNHYCRDMAYETLRDCAFVTIVVLAGCTLATIMYVAISVGKKRRAVELRFTINQETTGGCTFAWIAMDKAWGYWDVTQGLWWRVLLASLGV